jgi:hypothetical protein
MVSVTHPTHDIEVTAERLQENSACLRIQNGVRSTLERHESATNKGVGSAESTKATHR